MILDKFAIVFDHLSTIKLALLTILFILVRVLRVLVIRVVCITIYTNLEWFLVFLVGATSRNGIFDHLEGFGYCCIGIEERAIGQHFEACFAHLRSSEGFLHCAKEFHVVHRQAI